jgi:hypothetical protein
MTSRSPKVLRRAEQAGPAHVRSASSLAEPQSPFILSLSKPVLSPVEGDPSEGRAGTGAVESRGAPVANGPQRAKGGTP